MATTTAGMKVIGATTSFLSALRTPENTQTALEEARDYYTLQIREGPYLIDPALVGNAKLSDFIASKPRSREEVNCNLNWCTRLNAGEESDPEQPQHDVDYDGDDASSETIDERFVDRYTVTIGRDHYQLQDVLGPEREVLIHEMHDLKERDFPDPPYAARPRFPWQKSGTAMMRHARGIFGGSLNIDEMGLGKTTQALDDVYGDPRCENDAFNLVLTEKSVLMTWAKEGEKSYTENHRPRISILDGARTTFADLWADDIDIVVASYATVMYQFKKLNNFKLFMEIWQQCGREVALKVAEEKRLPTTRPTVSIFTALMEFLPFRIPTKVLDEAHRLKKWNGVNRTAVKTILSYSVSLLSGTPCGNVFTDIFTMPDLFPNEFPITRAEWFKVFAPQQANRRHKSLNRVEFSNIVRYLLPFTFGRTIDLLELPGIIYEPRVEFELTPQKSEMTLYLIDRFLYCARMGLEGRDTTEDDMHSAMGFCTKAEQEASFPCLAKYTSEQVRAFEEKPLDFDRVCRLFAAAVMNKLAETEEQDPFVVAEPSIIKEEHTAVVPNAQRPLWAQIDPKDLSGRDYTIAMTRWLLDGGFAVLHSDIHDRTQGSTSAANRPFKHLDEDIDLDDQITEENDLEDIAEEEDDIDEQEGLNTASVCKPALVASAPDKRKRKNVEKFSKEAKALRDADLQTPRCMRLLELYDQICHDFPTEKMIVWSRFHTALILLQEAFLRFRKITAPIYSGALSTHERTQFLTRWVNAELTPSTTPILFQAKSGNTGLTITAASHAIFLEDWWNRQDSIQAERRIYRYGQSKKVHVWRLFATNSFADAIIEAGGLRKLKTIDRLYSALRPPPGQSLEIPELVPQIGNRGYTNYHYYDRLDELTEEGIKEEEEAHVVEGGDRKRQKTEAAGNIEPENEEVMMDTGSNE